MKQVSFLLTVGFLVTTPVFPEALKEDAYSERIGEDFIENTVFRFRTKFHRTYVETDGFKTLLSRKIDKPPHLDGLLEDDCWKVADYTKSAWVQWVSKEVTKKQTVAYVCHDDKNLYMAIVAEEPSLKTVRMMSQHPGGRATWTTAGNGDGIEAFLELGGVGGTGQVFQYIFNIHPEVSYDGLFPPYVPFVGATDGKPGTGYRVKGTLGGKRWTVELAFPYKGFNTDKTEQVDYTYEGPPRRGEIWGLRMLRNGPKVWGGEERMNSNWTFNPTTSNHIPFPTGVIVFEDPNALHNGGMNEVEPKTNLPTFWKTNTIGDLAKGSLAFNAEQGNAIIDAEARNVGEGFQVTQRFGMLPNVGYRLKAKLKKVSGDGTVSVGIDKPWLKFDLTKDNEWEIFEEDYFSDPQQREATFFISVAGGTAKVAIDQLSIEQQVYGAPTGAICLTGNSPRPDLNYGFDPDNAKAAEEAQKDMKYTYRHPLTGEERFPFEHSWGPGWTNGVPDPGGTTGWIPFTKGSLTAFDKSRDLIYWSHDRPTAGWRPYPEGHEVIFDFGKDFYIRALEMLPSESVYNITVSVKEDGGDKFYVSRKLAGEGVLHPRSPVLFGRLRRVNSVARYIKLWFVGVHGLYFVRVWGEEKGKHEGISRFRWKEGLVVPERKYKQFEKLKGPVLMPKPQEVEWGDGEFLLKDGVAVLYQDKGKGKSTATHLRDEVKARLGIDLKLVEQKADEPDSSGNGAIVIGEAEGGGLAMRLAEKRGWQISYERPGKQGYFLSSKPEGILLSGFDQAGTFYGVQTLLQVFVRRDYATAGARGVEIRDWPYIPLRQIEFRGPGTATPAFVRAFAMLKGNTMGNHGRPETAKMCDDFFILPGWDYCGHQGGSPLEMEDDENYVYLAGPMGYGRVNCCPSHLQRYEFIHRHAQNTGGMNLQGINLGLDEMDLWRGGARWNADRRCLRRGMGGDELFTEMILRSYDIFREYNTRTALLDTMLMSTMQGGNGSYHNMYRAFELLPSDVHICSWKGLEGDENSNPETALQRYQNVTLLQGSFPFRGRGKVNEYYKAPPGNEVQGHWSTVWGIAGPTDQVLTGQFCRPMTSVDGGCSIQFLCQAWNPDTPPIHSDEWAMMIGHLQQRFGEIVLERELPSWRDGVQKEFFKVDMRNSVNWSHIDPVPGDDKDWLDWGSNNDLGHIPRGDVTFEEVPFHVIEPENNSGKSIVMVSAEAEGHLSTLPRRSADISVNRKAASLVFLRTNINGGFLPGYRVTYEGNRYLTIELEAMGNSSNGYSCYGLYESGAESRPPTPNDGNYNAKSLYHQMTNYFSLFFRLAWLGASGAGDPLKITMHEWVNPYPELTIKSVSVETPQGRGRSRLEVLFAITGIAPVQRDLDLWKNRSRLPLVSVNEVEIEEGDIPVITDKGEWIFDPEKESMENPDTEFNYHDETDKLVCSVRGFGPGDPKYTNNANLFMKRDNAWLVSGGVLKLASPQVCKKLALRTQFFWEYHGRRVVYGVTSFRRTDYEIEVSADGQTWTNVGGKQGACGEDGDQVHRLPATPIQYVRLKLDGQEKYVTERSSSYSYGPGVSWLQLYK